MSNEQEKNSSERVADVEVLKETPEGAKITRKWTRFLLEILVYGEKKDKDRIDKFTKELQKQMDTRKAYKRARIFWYVDDGEKTVEEKKKWLIENMNCKYYVFAPENYRVDKDFVKDTLERIRQFERSFELMKSAGIGINKVKPEPEPKQEQETETQKTEAQ